MTGRSHDPDGELATAARERFEHAVASLEMATTNRLRLLRRETLANDRPPGRGLLLPMAAVAAMLLAFGLAWRLPPTAAPASVHDAVADAATVYFPDEDDALVYAWLGDAPVATGKL